MIREYESIMTETEKQNEVWFPNFIIVRKPISEGGDAQGGDPQNEWKGMLREVQKGVKKQIDGLKQDQKKINSTLESKIDQCNLKISQHNVKITEQN